MKNQKDEKNKAKQEESDKEKLGLKKVTWEQEKLNLENKIIR